MSLNYSTDGRLRSSKECFLLPDILCKCGSFLPEMFVSVLRLIIGLYPDQSFYILQRPSKL